MIPKTIVISHYHLLRGGIRSAIEKSLTALYRCGGLKDRRIRFLIGRPDGVQSFLRSFDYPGMDLEVIVDSRIDYRNDPWPDEPGFRQDVSNLAAWFLGQGVDHTIFWIHNPTLGKNPLVTAAWHKAAQLAYGKNAPYRFLYHIHDFAECGRLENLVRIKRCWHTGGISELYPAAGNVGYAAINSVDTQRLISSGIPPDRVFYISNVVLPISDNNKPGASKQKLERSLALFAKREGYTFKYNCPWWVIPLRLIRRKNVLEALVLGALADCSPQLLVTLDANSDSERPYAEKVKSLVRKLKLPMIIGFGLELVGKAFSFSELLQCSETVVTTSLLEGFGFAFLDGPLHRRHLVGRNLSHVTQDFQPAGFPHEGLYEQLLVNVPADTRKRLLAAGVKFVDFYSDLLGMPLECQDLFLKELSQIFKAETLDFGFLDLDAQAEMISRLNDRRFSDAIRGLNPMASEPATFKDSFPDQIYKRFGPRSHALEVENAFDTLFELPAASWDPYKTSQNLVALYFRPDHHKPLYSSWP